LRRTYRRAQQDKFCGAGGLDQIETENAALARATTNKVRCDQINDLEKALALDYMLRASTNRGSNEWLN
jgi:hypothetical protein